MSQDTSVIMGATRVDEGLPAHDLPNLAVPDHELLRRIGVGAYGEVWLARNVFGTYRAVKIVYRKSFKNERPFEREYRGIQKFEPISRTNDGLIDILQIGRNETDGWFYYVMELADDASSLDALDVENYVPKSLQQVVRQRGRIEFTESLQIALSLSLALGHLHRHGLIHRDIKPSNIIFVGGVPKLADIGLVTDLEEARSFVGTEGFIPPEGPNSPQADIYSLGKVLYEMSMGKDRMDFPEPFTALGQATGSHDLEELNAIIIKACATDPSERYQTAEEMHLDLALLQSGKSVKSRRTLERRLIAARRVATVVAAIALVAFGGYLFQRRLTREERRIADEREIQNTEIMFQRGNSALALAHLAQIVRNNPANRVAVERIVAALHQRNFPQVAFEPIRHPDKVKQGNFSADGRLVLSVCDDNQVRIFRSDNGQTVCAPLRHPDTVRAAQFSPDSKRVATASSRTVWLWDVSTGAPALSPLVHEARVDVATYSPNGEWLATTCADGYLRLFRASDGKLVHELKSYEADLPVRPAVIDASFSRDSAQIATLADDRTTLVWQVDSGKLKHRFSLEKEVSPRQLQISPNAQFLAVNVFTSGGWQAQIWNLTLAQPVREPFNHPGRIYSIQFSPDSSRLLTGCGDFLGRVWDIESRQIIFELPHHGFVHSIGYSPDGGRIVTGSADHSARVWDASTGEPLGESLVHEGRVRYAEFSPDGKALLTASADHRLRIWKLGEHKDALRIFRHNAYVHSTEVHRSGNEILTATSGQSSTAADANLRRGGRQVVVRWNAETGATNLFVPLPNGGEALAAQFTDDGPKAFVTEEYGDRHGRIIDLRTGRMVGAEIVHDRENEFACARFSNDGQLLATGGARGALRLWNGKLGNAVAPSYQHSGRINSIRFSPDGSMLVISGEDGTAAILAGANGQRVAPPLAHNAGVWFAQFSQPGNAVVTTSRDYTAKIWMTNGTLVATLQHRAEVEYAEFSPDGSTVVTASSDGTARVCNASTGKITQSLEHLQPVLMARFSPDGLRLVTAAADGTAQLWDVQTGLKLADAFRHAGAVVSVAFTFDGRRVVTGSLDHTVKTWEIPLQDSKSATALAEAAEAVGGLRLNGDRMVETVPWKR